MYLGRNTWYRWTPSCSLPPYIICPQHLLNIYRITSECRLITEYLVLPGHLTVQGVCEGARARGEQSLLPQAEEAAAARAGAERVR